MPKLNPALVRAAEPEQEIEPIAEAEPEKPKAPAKDALSSAARMSEKTREFLEALRASCDV